MARQGEARRNRWVVVTAVLVVLLVMAGFFVLFLFTGEARKAATSQSSSTDSYLAPGPKPKSVEGLDEHEDDTPLISEYDCQNFMTIKEYSSFMDRLYELEVISQMQPSDRRLELMQPYATEAFMKTQKGFFERPIAEGISIEVSRESGMSCMMSSKKELLARITPTVTVVQQNDDGTKIVLHEPMTLPATHFTRWVQSENIWYVNEDKK
jgi:hypothetical protein